MFQQLLATLSEIAKKHQASIAAVATRFVLQQKGVGAAIIGVRHSRHLTDTLRVFDFELDQQDLAAIRHLLEQAQGPVGDVYSVERIKGGKHASIMKYNLNKD